MAYQRKQYYRPLSAKINYFLKKFKVALWFILAAVLLAGFKYRISIADYIQTFFW